MERHPLSVAFDEWAASLEGQRCLETLNFCTPGQAKYLRNRIQTAFFAGWNTREKATSG